MVHLGQSPVKGSLTKGFALDGRRYGRVTGWHLGRPDDIDGRIEGGRPVAPAVARPQALAEATRGVVGSKRMTARARDQCIHRTCKFPQKERA
jgi:hypothetical protein